MDIKWNKIDWDKINNLITTTDTSRYADGDDGYNDEPQNHWYVGAALINIDDPSNFPENFTWEDAFHAGLPELREYDSEYKVIGYFAKDKRFDQLSYYSDENPPCFWYDEKDGNICYPDAWISYDEFLQLVESQIPKRIFYWINSQKGV